MIRPLWAADGRDGAVVERIAATVASPGAKTLSFPGRATPRPIFAALAKMRLPWNTVTLLPSDDRNVSETHAASNFGQLQRAFGATAAIVSPLTLGTRPPRLALTWVGVGADGHVASLFPDADRGSWRAPGVISVTPYPLPVDAPFSRLSMTLASLADAEAVILVARGKDKRRVLDAAIEGADLPVTRLFDLARVTIYWSLV